MKISLKNRKIGYTYSSVSGVFSFRREKSIAFESTLERDLLTILEFNDSVLDVIEQPVTIEYTNNNGKLTTYTPDFLVHFKTNDSFVPKSMLIEVKPSNILKKKFDNLRPKFKVATSYAQENDYIFKIYDENRIRGIDLKNISFLQRYKLLQYDKYEEDIICKHLKAVGHTTIDHLLAHLYVSDMQRGTALGQIWHLISNKIIGCDIGRPLNQGTCIWLNVNETYEEGILNELYN